MPGSRSGNPAGADVGRWSVDAVEVAQVERRIVLLILVLGAVQEVESLDADLELVGFVNFEIFEDSKLVVEVGRPMDVWDTEGTVLSDTGRGEAGGVEVLVRLEALARIACHEWDGGLVGSAGDGVVAYADALYAGTRGYRWGCGDVPVDADRLVSAVLVVIGAALRNVGKRCAGAVLLDA